MAGRVGGTRSSPLQALVLRKCCAARALRLDCKGYRHLAKTLATQTGMTKKWLQSQGLISVRDLWMEAHGYA